MYKSELKSEIRFWRCELLFSSKAFNFDFTEEEDAKDFYENVLRKNREASMEDLVSIESLKGLFSFYKDTLSSVSMTEKIVRLDDLE